MLPIGGLKEKLLAAHRGGIDTVIIPHENARDLTEIPRNIKQNLNIRPVRWIDEVLDIALTELPEVKVADPEAAEPVKTEGHELTPETDKEQGTGARIHH